MVTSLSTECGSFFHCKLRIYPGFYLDYSCMSGTLIPFLELVF